MFKKADSPEAFEKLINTQDNDVNNIDLNGDGDVDYIQVIDKSAENAHAFVLQVAVSETETQDIAVIELEKTGDTTAVLQIVGDEDIYGEQLIVEASDGTEEVLEEMNTGGKGRGPSATFDAGEAFVVINVWRWPTVRFVYAPMYRPWASPWRWRNYPGWFRPWRPVRWGLFRPRCARYYHPGFQSGAYTQGSGGTQGVYALQKNLGRGTYKEQCQCEQLPCYPYYPPHQCYRSKGQRVQGEANHMESKGWRWRCKG